MRSHRVQWESAQLASLWESVSRRKECDGAKQSAGLITRSRGKVQRIRAGIEPTAERQRPQSIDHQRLAMRIFQLVDEGSVIVEYIDPAVAEVADENLTAVRPERERRPSDAPG